MNDDLRPTLMGIRRCLELLADEASRVGAEEVVLLITAAAQAAQDAESVAARPAPMLRLVYSA